MADLGRAWRCALWAVCVSILVPACADPVDAPEAPDSGFADAMLGGDAEGACGPCGRGTWIETTDGRRHCSGESALNACGGCTPLAATVGSACGPCGGSWQCDAGEITCVGGGERNACGGCAELDAPVNFGCYNGIYTCSGPNDVVCRDTGANACGGDADVELDPPPGTACGTCGQGVVVCDGGTATMCADGELGVNACGGCAPLAGVPGTACGCGGTWECHENGVRCAGAEESNACGGCGPLPDPVGGPCADGVTRCDGDDATVCASEDTNACGGTVPLDGTPGDPCGPCQDGVLRCASADSLACVAASPVNACGGCGVLVAEPGTTCGTGRRWQCRGGTLDCAVAGTVNPCGGLDVLTHDPGGPCGECSAGIALCVSPNRTACFGGGADVRNACGGCEEIRVDDAPFRDVPGAACGTCNTGSWTCASPNEIACVGEVEETLRTVHADRDGDGFGSPTETRQVCAVPPGYVENDRDCDDDDSDARPGGLERCNGKDDDCDGEVDEDFIAYADTDLDGFGDPDAPVVACVLSAGVSPNGEDCDDDDPRAFPGQTTGFAEPRDDGTWDYDCDGFSTPTLTDRPECRTPPLCGTDGYTYATEGWALEAFPDCGGSAAWILRCELTLSGCTSTVDPNPRPQLCR